VMDHLCVCDTCNRVSEVFQLPGRKDRNCNECSTDIAVVISLYPLMKNANYRPRSVELEHQVKPIIERLLSRCNTASYSCGSSGPLLLTSSATEPLAPEETAVEENGQEAPDEFEIRRKAFFSA
jgi:hypothetical protein